MGECRPSRRLPLLTHARGWTAIDEEKQLTCLLAFQPQPSLLVPDHSQGQEHSVLTRSFAVSWNDRGNVPGANCPGISPTSSALVRSPSRLRCRAQSRWNSAQQRSISSQHPYGLVFVSRGHTDTLQTVDVPVNRAFKSRLRASCAKSLAKLLLDCIHTRRSVDLNLKVSALKTPTFVHHAMPSARVSRWLAPLAGPTRGADAGPR